MWRLKGHAQRALLAVGRVVGGDRADARRSRVRRCRIRSSANRDHAARHQGRSGRRIRDGAAVRGEAGTCPSEGDTRRGLARRVADARPSSTRSPTRPWIVWGDLNAETEALTKAIPGAVEVRGPDSIDVKRPAGPVLLAGEIRVLVSEAVDLRVGTQLAALPRSSASRIRGRRITRRFAEGDSARREMFVHVFEKSRPRVGRNRCAEGIGGGGLAEALSIKPARPSSPSTQVTRRRLTPTR